MGNKIIFCILLAVAVFFLVADYTADTKSDKVKNKIVINANPELTVSTIYPTSKKWENICTYFNKYQSIKYRDVLDKQNIEQMLGHICYKDEKDDCNAGTIHINEFYKLGMRKDDWIFLSLIKQGGSISASLVDIDNDGVQELRFWYYAGTANCMRTDFWKKDALGHYKFIDAKGYGDITEDGSGCNAHLIFVPYDNSIYTLYINDYGSDSSETPRIWDILRGSVSELKLICTDKEWILNK